MFLLKVTFSCGQPPTENHTEGDHSNTALYMLVLCSGKILNDEVSIPVTRSFFLFNSIIYATSIGMDLSENTSALRITFIRKAIDYKQFFLRRARTKKKRCRMLQKETPLS